MPNHLKTIYQKHLISVIIPVFNGEETIERAVRSVLDNRTDETEIEVILVDDGSTDDTPAICDQLSRQAGVRALHIENSGAAAARNVGLRETKGEFIGFVDSDDWVEPDMYRALLRCLLDQQADLAACAVIQETEYGSFPEENDGQMEEWKSDAVYHQILLSRGIRGYLWNKLYRKVLIMQELDESLSQCEDLLFNALYCERVKKAVYLRKALYHYVRRANRDSLFFSKRDLSLMSAQEKLYALYVEKAPQYAIIPAQNALKTYLHFRARAKLCGERDETLLSMIRQGMKAFFRPVMENRKISLQTKGNICFTYLFPGLSLRLKRTILQRRHRKGIWES